MEIAKELFNDGSIWALVIALIYIFNNLKPLIKSHLKTNHDKLLFANACRAVATVEQIAEASPSDREKRAISIICTFANKNHIPINIELAQAFFNQALVHFKANGGVMKKPALAKAPIEQNAPVTNTGDGDK